MTRQSVIVVFVWCLMSARAGAQTTYAVKADVDVHKAPVTSSPVIGHAKPGRAIELTRDVGDWVQVVWADAPERTGYVRVRLGSSPLPAFRDMPAIPSAAAAPAVPATFEPAAAPQQSVEPAPLSASRPVPSERPAASERRATALSADGYQLPVHTAGFGLRMDPRFRDFGGTARLWMQRRLGAQFDVTRSTFTSGLTAGQLTTWQFSPSMLYALPDVVSSAVWVRPFAGGGLDLVRSSLGGVTPGMTTGHDRTFGTKILGGAEVTLPGAPQLTLSTEVGYHWLESSFTAFDLGGVRASVAAHWYVK